MNPHLSIGTTTDRINLLDENGFLLKDWIPVEGGHDSNYVESSLGDYGQVISYRDTDVDEKFVLTIKRSNQDDVIEMGQNLRRMLRTALNYWTDSWREDFVYIAARAAGETNTRYAIVKDGSIPKDNNPFAMPFAQCAPVMNDFELFVTRGPWLDDVPGTGTATEIAGYYSYCIPRYLEFDGVNDYVNCHSDAKLDNLPDNAVAGKGQITVEAWIRLNTSTPNTYIAAKGDRSALGVGWWFGYSTTIGLVGEIFCVSPDLAHSQSGLGEFTANGEWQHVLMTYSETGAGMTGAAATIYLAIGGVWSAGPQVASATNYSQDDALDLTLGAILWPGFGVVSFLNGDIGWVRISSAVIYDPGGGNFTPGERCLLPAVGANTEGVWIYEGFGNTTGNLDGGADGDIVGYDAGIGAEWACDCALAYGNVDRSSDVEPKTTDEVYFANKFNDAPLTHIFVSDGGAFGSNLLDADPFVDIDLLPAGVADGDAIYFGIETTGRIDYGPFCSLVFDIKTAADLEETLWEYSNGAAGWPDLTVQDNTNQGGLGGGTAFDTTGVVSVHWEQPAWVVEDVNGVTGFWVRLYVVDSGNNGPPTQQNRHIYTITWPYIEIDSDQVKGDILSQVKLRLREQSNLDGITRIIGGLRSASRGADFRSYLNFSEQQNGVGIVCEALNTGGFAADVTVPSGRKIAVTNAIAAWTAVSRFTIYFGTAVQYRGTFHVFLRVDQDNGSAPGDIKLKVKSYFFGKDTATFDSGILELANTSQFHVIDVGRAQFIPPDTYESTDRFTLEIEIEAFGNVAADVDLIDLILIPVDEWAFDIRAPGTDEVWGTNRDELWLGDCVSLDGIEYPRRSLRSIQTGSMPEDVFMSLLASANSATGFPPRTEARIHFFGIDDTGKIARHELAGTARAWSMAQYLSMRGDR